jgi:hypothetical protein
MKKQIGVIVLAIVLATVGFVAADEAGIITINISNNSNGQLITNVSNSTIQGQANFTNSLATQNITLTNSTLTLNVNGQNITISSQNGNIVIASTGQNLTLASDTQLVPLNITSSPSWIEVVQTGSFNVFYVTQTPDMYTFHIYITDSTYYPAVQRLLSSQTITSVFPTEFYTDFGLQQKVSVYSFNQFNVTSMTPRQYDSTDTTAQKIEIGIAILSDPNHASNTYLPDKPNNNSGEQFLRQAIAYYFSQYIQSNV